MRLLLALTLALSPLSEPAMLGEILHLLRVIEKRATSSPATDSLMHALGLRGDAASSTGSLHAKVKDIKDNPPSVINSIQRGTIVIPADATSVSATATITSVTTAKAAIHHLGGTEDQGGTGTATIFVVTAASTRSELTNATTVTAYRGSHGNGPSTTVGYSVVEYK